MSEILGCLLEMGKEAFGVGVGGTSPKAINMTEIERNQTQQTPLKKCVVE